MIWRFFCNTVQLLVFQPQLVLPENSLPSFFAFVRSVYCELEHGAANLSEYRCIRPLVFGQRNRLNVVLYQPIPHLAPDVSRTEAALAQDTFQTAAQVGRDIIGPMHENIVRTCVAQGNPRSRFLQHQFTPKSAGAFRSILLTLCLVLRWPLCKMSSAPGTA